MGQSEINKRRELKRELDRRCVEMDLDALRFVTLVAAMLVMTPEELLYFKEQCLDKPRRKRGKRR